VLSWTKYTSQSLCETPDRTNSTNLVERVLHFSPHCVGWMPESALDGVPLDEAQKSDINSIGFPVYRVTVWVDWNASP
jgi:hypothetical protein